MYVYIYVFSEQNLHFEIDTHPNYFCQAFIYLSRMRAFFVPETPRVIPSTSFRNPTTTLSQAMAFSTYKWRRASLSIDPPPNPLPSCLCWEAHLRVRRRDNRSSIPTSSSGDNFGQAFFGQTEFDDQTASDREPKTKKASQHYWRSIHRLFRPSKTDNDASNVGAPTKSAWPFRSGLPRRRTRPRNRCRSGRNTSWPRARWPSPTRAQRSRGLTVGKPAFVASKSNFDRRIRWCSYLPAIGDWAAHKWMATMTNRACLGSCSLRCLYMQ